MHSNARNATCPALSIVIDIINCLELFYETLKMLEGRQIKK